jgi:hypothetical protein
LGGIDRLNAFSTGSLHYRKLGKIGVDCKFRSSDSLWGVIGGGKRPAGILYIDFVFDQTKKYRLSSATILVTLQDVELLPAVETTIKANGLGDKEDESAKRHLRVTDKFGPAKITGEPKTVPVTTKISMTPNLTVMGDGGGGVGRDIGKTHTHVTRC